MTSRSVLGGIGDTYGRKPFWLTGDLEDSTQFGHGGCPKLRNLGCGLVGETALDSLIRRLVQLIQEEGCLEYDTYLAKVPYFQHEV